MDCGDCCPEHGTKSVPCSSAACCVGHCVGVAPILDPPGLRLRVRSNLADRASDQVPASTIGSPPFRPPRA
jgi:hypothetical protein